MKRLFVFLLIANISLGLFAQSEQPESGRIRSEIHGIFEMNGYTVVSDLRDGFTHLTISKGSDRLDVRHYSTVAAATAAKASVEALAAPNTVFTDDRNLYWGSAGARAVYVHALNIEGLAVPNAGYANLLRAIQIANNTIWKYTSFDEWKDTRVLNPRPKYNITTGETVGRSYNLYEYTNILEMLLAAMKSLQVIKGLPGADPVYAYLFNFYEQLVWDASTISLDYYKGFAVVTSSTRANVRWENIYGVPRQTTIDPENYDVSGRQNVYDDQMWLIRCFLEVYFMLEKEADKITGNALATSRERRKWYLDISEYLSVYCLDGWDQSKRPDGTEWGGITWGPGYATKHTCSNSPFISPLVWLYEIYKDSEDKIEHLVRGGYNTNTVTTKSTLKSEYFFDYAVRLYDFIYHSFKRPDDVYGDLIRVVTTIPETGPNAGLRTTTSHGDQDPRAYSYNSGSTLSGIAELYRVTTDPQKKERYYKELVALSDASFNFFADANEKEGFYFFPQHRTGKAEFDSCLLRAWVEAYIYGIYNTSRYVDAFSKTLNFAFDNFYVNGFLPMNHLTGWNPEMTATDLYNNRDDVRVSCLRTFNYSAQFSWISLSEFFKLELIK